MTHDTSHVTKCNKACDKTVNQPKLNIIQWNCKLYVATKQYNYANKTIGTCYMTCDKSHVSKCYKACDKMVIQPKVNRIQWNFKLKLPSNKTMQTKQLWHALCKCNKACNKIVNQPKL